MLEGHGASLAAVGDAGGKVVLSRTLLQALPVQAFQEGEIALLRCGRNVRRRVEIQDPRLGGADDRALIERGQPAVGPVIAAPNSGLIFRWPGRLGFGQSSLGVGKLGVGGIQSVRLLDAGLHLPFDERPLLGSCCHQLL